MMQSRIAAIVLCVLAQAASAQCTAPSAAPMAAHLQAVSEPVRPAGPAQGTPAARPNRELIKTATAGTRDDMPPVVAREPRAKGEQDQPRRGGTAMLLAALALMSGIALRRYGAPRA